MLSRRYVNINLAVDAYEILDRHCRLSGQTKTVAIERMIRACYGPGRKLDDADIIAAQGDCEEGGNKV